MISTPPWGWGICSTSCANLTPSSRRGAGKFPKRPPARRSMPMKKPGKFWVFSRWSRTSGSASPRGERARPGRTARRTEAPRPPTATFRTGISTTLYREGPMPGSARILPKPTGYGTNSLRRGSY